MGNVSSSIRDTILPCTDHDTDEDLSVVLPVGQDDDSSLSSEIHLGSRYCFPFASSPPRDNRKRKYDTIKEDASDKETAEESNTIPPTDENDDDRRQVLYDYLHGQFHQLERGNNDASFDHQGVLAVLKERPELLLEEFRYYYTPIYYFLMAGADLETIQELCRIYQEAKLEKAGVENFAPIHAAVHCGSRHNGVLAYLVQQFPEMLLQEFHTCIPLKTLLERFETYGEPSRYSEEEQLEWLKYLIRFKPSMVAHDEWLLDKILGGEYGSAIRQYIFSVFAEVGTQYSLADYSFEYLDPLDQEAGVALSLALGNAQKVDIAYPIWTFEGYRSFWQSASDIEPKNLKSFSCPILLPLANDTELQDTILHFIKSIDTLEDISFVHVKEAKTDADSGEETTDSANDKEISNDARSDDENTADHHKLVAFCMACVKANHVSSVQSVTFKNFKTSTNDVLYDWKYLMYCHHYTNVVEMSI